MYVIRDAVADLICTVSINIILETRNNKKRHNKKSPSCIRFVKTFPAMQNINYLWQKTYTYCLILI